MNAQIRSELLLEPRPAEADDVRVDREGLLWRTVWIQGKTAIPFGPGFMHVAQATEAALFVRQAHGLA